MIFAPYAMDISTLLARPIALIGFVVSFFSIFSSTLPFSFRISLKTRIQCEFFFRSFFNKEEDFDGIHE
jgi:hypothetical protein